MGSILDGVVREDYLEEGMVSRRLSGVTEQPSRVLRRAFQAKGAPSEKMPRQKKKKVSPLCLSCWHNFLRAGTLSVFFTSTRPRTLSVM